MKDELILVSARARTWPAAGEAIGQAIVLNGLLVYKKAMKPRGRTWPVPNDPADLAKKLAKALGVKIERLHVKTDKWWAWEDVEACVKGLLVLSKADRRKLMKGRHAR